MDATETQALVSDLEHLKHRARGDRRATSLPLLTFGLITLVGAVFAADGISNWSFFYWPLAVPAGFGALAWLRRRRAAETGVGEGREPYGWFAVGFFVLLLIPFGILVAFAPLLAIAAGLVYVAARQRNWYLGICAAVFGVVGTLEVSFHSVSNVAYDVADALGLYRARYGYFDWSQELIVGLLAVFLLVAGLVAHRREVGAA